MATVSQGPAATTSTTISAVELPFVQHNAQPQPTQQQATSIASSLPSQGLQVTMQSKIVNATSGSWMIIPQLPFMTTASSTLQSQTMPAGLASMTLASSYKQQKGAISVPPVILNKNCAIWQGIIEFQEKAPTSIGPHGPQPSHVIHSLACRFLSKMTNGKAEINAEKWPNHLVLQSLPKQLITSGNLKSVLRTGSRHVFIDFSTESEGLQKLTKAMSDKLVGCIQFQAPCDLRIMVAIYFPEKRLYMGFIPNDQETFFNAIHQAYQTFCNKQKSNSGNIGSNNGQRAQGLPLGQQQVGQIQSQQPLPPALSSTMVPAISQPISVMSSQVEEAARQQNLLKLQQTQQTLDAAKAEELQYQQQQLILRQQHQRMLIEQHQQMLRQQQQRMLIEQHQQMLRQQQQRMLRQQQQKLRQQQQMLRQHWERIEGQDAMMTQQVQHKIQSQHQLLMEQPQDIHQEPSTNVPPGGMNTSVPEQQAASPSQQQQQSPSWGDSGFLDLVS